MRNGSGRGRWGRSDFCKKKVVLSFVQQSVHLSNNVYFIYLSPKRGLTAQYKPFIIYSRKDKDALHRFCRHWKWMPDTSKWFSVLSKIIFWGEVCFVLVKDIVRSSKQWVGTASWFILTAKSRNTLMVCGQWVCKICRHNVSRILGFVRIIHSLFCV